MPKGRAETESQKKEILDKLLKAWKKQPLLRLGQLIDNAMYLTKTELFHIEDESLIERVLHFVGPLIPDPRFTHDCQACIYLGQDTDHDFYFCNSRLPTVIARFGSNGPDYASGLEAALQIEKNYYPDYGADIPLVKALKLARKRGLVPESKH